MPWNERNCMSLRREFLALCEPPGANVSELCRRFQISRKTGYKWLDRGTEALADQSRRPHSSPERTPAKTEALILRVRDQYHDWGARKLKRYLENKGHPDLPSVSTITQILHRHGRITRHASQAAQPWQRFEHAEPNHLWQMDYKGHVAMTHGRVHPLTVLDDHSRFNLVLEACARESMDEVQAALIPCFRRYGLPQRISCDNGSPWGNTRSKEGLTHLGVWMARLGIGLTHARPGHPQTNGKDERFHRTLKSSVLQGQIFTGLAHAQRAFDAFRDLYNHERPHQALQLDVPISRYRPSQRPYPEVLPEPQYDSGSEVRKVSQNGLIHFKGHRYRVAKALDGQQVAIVPDRDNDALYTVYFFQTIVRKFDLRLDEFID